MLKRFVAAILTVLTVFGLFSCKSQPKDGDTVETDSHQSETCDFLASDLGDYCIIYADGISMDAFKKVRALQSALEKTFGVKPDSAGQGKTEQEKEILIGKTNRSAQDEIFALAPKVNDYAIGTVGKKLVVAAHTDQMLMAALDALIASLTSLDSDSKVFFEPSMCKNVTGEYSMNTIFWGVHDVKDYTVVCEDSKEGTTLATMVRDAIVTKCGYDLDISTTPVEGNMILVGNTSKGVPTGMTDASKDFYYMGMEGANLYLYGAELPAAYEAVEAFCRLVDSAVGDIATVNVEQGTVESADDSLTAMSFNILYKTDDAQRMENVVATIRNHMPDTFGVQEATGEWMVYLSDVLKDEYAYVGTGRTSSGDSERNAVFYRKDKFELLDFGTKWMSDTPDVADSKVSGSIYPRIFTYAVLKVKATGEKFIHVNTHTDHVDQGDQIRLQQVKVIVEFLKNNYPDVPTILTGDMNDTVNKPSMSYLLMSGFDNTAEIAVVGDDVPTFKDKVIDFLLVSQNDFLVYRYEVDVKQYNGEYPSDHRAIVMQYRLQT